MFRLKKLFIGLLSFSGSLATLTTYMFLNISPPVN